jgi:type VI secretion system protein ImpJ
MKLLQPVIWSKGTFLQPQHLQMQDRFLESLIEFRTRELCFKPYGFANLTIDSDRLATDGVFQIVEAKGLMPDGLTLDIPASDPPIEPRPLDIEIFNETERGGKSVAELDLYIAAPLQLPGKMAVSVGKRQANTRYVADLTDVNDETSGTNPKAVQVARKNLRILLETEKDALEGCSAMRIARVARHGESSFRIAAGAPPPVLGIRASGYLNNLCRSLIDTLAARAAELSKGRRNKDRSLADFTVSDTPGFWLLHTLNTSLPIMREYCEGAAVHPVLMYREMLSLAGALLTFRLNTDELPRYDHDNPGACFTSLAGLIRKLAAEAIPRNYDSVVLRPKSDINVYSAAIPDNWFARATRWYLAVASDLKPEQWLDMIPKLGGVLKVASGNDIQGLIEAALYGMNFTFDSSPPSTLPTQSAFRYFELDTQDDLWQGIKRARNLAVYVPGQLPKPSLELVVLLAPDRQEA